MNSKNRQTIKPHVLILKFTDKLDQRRGENRIIKSYYLLHMEKHKTLIQ